MVLFPPVVFYWKSVFLLILRIIRKKPASESLIFNKLQAWGSETGVFLLILWNVWENLRMAAAIYEKSYKFLMS